MKILSFSGGRTSAYMLANYEFDLAIFCNTGKEAEGTLDFVRKCGEYFEKEIIWLEYTTDNNLKFKIVDFKTANRDGKPFEQLIKKFNFLPNQQMRFCTVEMKAKTIKRYLKNNGYKINEIEMLLGIRADEPNRYFKLKNTNRNGWENEMPLYKDSITKKHILEFWNKQPFDLIINSHEGNCDLCFLKGLTKKIELLRQKPEVAKWWAEMENLIKAKFNKNYTVENLLNMSKSQLNIFENDIDCFCNID